jgi:hypothetical protein
MAGTRIDDHKSWIGAGPAGVVFPAGAKMKESKGTEGDGGLSHYEDTNEEIVHQQKVGVGKLKSYKQREVYRN